MHLSWYETQVPCLARCMQARVMWHIHHSLGAFRQFASAKTKGQTYLSRKCLSCRQNYGYSRMPGLMTSNLGNSVLPTFLSEGKKKAVQTGSARSQRLAVWYTWGPRDKDWEIRVSILLMPQEPLQHIIIVMFGGLSSSGSNARITWTIEGDSNHILVCTHCWCLLVFPSFIELIVLI